MADGTPAAQVVTGTRQRYKVKTFAGQEIELLTTKERDLYREAQKKYQAENKFTAASDFRALDRLILFEVQVYRWQHHLAAECDYDNVDLEPSEQAALRRSVKDTEGLISQLQNDLGLTKVQRDKSSSAETVGAYLTELKIRARQFGVHRDAQLGKAMELLNEAFSIAGSYRRSSESERRKLGFETADDVVDWLIEVAQPMYNELDEHFRKTNQRYWIRAQ